jgi:hypothetical protein
MRMLLLQTLQRGRGRASVRLILQLPADQQVG